MDIDSTHRLSSAQIHPSEHCDLPQLNAGADTGVQGHFAAQLIVVHCISLPIGEFGTGAPSRLFTGTLDCSEHASFAELTGVRVAPHLFIDRQGCIEQFVPFDRPAWHAGQSAWMQRRGCNRFSLGIELEGTWTEPYADAQYVTLTDVCMALCQHYPSLSPSAIVGHQEIASGRKEDPGPHFDWTRLLLPMHRQLLGNTI